MMRAPIDSLVALASIALLGCGPGDPSTPGWRAVATDLPGALFSVTGTAADDVWVAGANQGSGPGLFHWDGVAWETPATGLDSGDLLWVHAFADGGVVAAGSGGQIIRGSRDDLERMATPDTRAVWGVWGASASDMWAVGGDANGGTGFIWRHDGDVWTEVAPGGSLPSPTAWFKVWGISADDVWFCGTGGALLHWTGADFEAVESGTSRTLLTINGRADGSLITAVGGQFSATLVASEDGRPFEDVTPIGDPPLQTFGVFHRGELAYAVGMQSLVLRHDGDGWVADEVKELPVFEDLHGVWIDPGGGVWAAGGQIIAEPFTRGALIYRGPEPPAAFQ